MQGERVQPFHQAQEAIIAGAILEGAVLQLRMPAVQVLADSGGVSVAGDVLGQRVYLCRREAQRRSHGADGRPGAHGVYIGHYGYIVIAEGAVDMVYDLFSAAAAEVYVYIRHLPPVGIQEAFKEEVMADGV